MKNPKMFQWRSAKNRVVRVLTAEDLKVFRLTPALENAGYRVPGEVLVREGYIVKRTRQVIEDRAADELAKAARKLKRATEGLVAAAQEASDEAL